MSEPKKLKLSILSTPEVRRGAADFQIDMAGPSFVPETPDLQTDTSNHENSELNLATNESEISSLITPGQEARVLNDSDTKSISSEYIFDRTSPPYR